MSSDAPDNSQQPPAAPNGQEEGGPPQLPAGDSKLPSRKDTSLREFLNKVDDYAPIVRQNPMPRVYTHMYDKIC